jgi:hypothetical protein
MDHPLRRTLLRLARYSAFHLRNGVMFTDAQRDTAEVCDATKPNSRLKPGSKKIDNISRTPNY